MVEYFSIDDSYKAAKAIRLKKYILVCCEQGMVTMDIDGKHYEIPENHLITITSGQYQRIAACTGKAVVLSFTFDYFCKDDQDIELIFYNGLFCHFDENEVIDIGRQSEIPHFLHQIQEELQLQQHQYLTAIHSKIKLLLIGINRAKISQGAEVWRPSATFLKFLESIRSDFQHNKVLTEYAQNLSTTVLKLNELSKLYAGKTAQQIIHSLVISEAQRLLLYDDLSIKELASALGFNDAFYFSNFFKKHTGLSPQDYKESFKSKNYMVS